MNRRSGFSLIEVVVAMVLIASVGMGLYAWINTNLISLNRVQAHNERREAVLNALAFMEQINPMETPSGEATLGAYNIHWEAQLVEPAQDGVGASGHRLGLYNTRVRLAKEGAEETMFRLRQVGYQKRQVAGRGSILGE